MNDGLANFSDRDLAKELVARNRTAIVACVGVRDTGEPDRFCFFDGEPEALHGLATLIADQMEPLCYPFEGFLLLDAGGSGDEDDEDADGPEAAF